MKTMKNADTMPTMNATREPTMTWLSTSRP